jgi:hypothetical protein
MMMHKVGNFSNSPLIISRNICSAVST